MEYYNFDDALLYSDVYLTDLYNDLWDEHCTFSRREKPNRYPNRVEKIIIITRRGTSNDYIKKRYINGFLEQITDVNGDYKYVCKYSRDDPGIPTSSEWFYKKRHYREDGPHTILYFMPFHAEFIKEDYESGIDLYDYNTFTRIFLERYNNFGEGNPTEIFYYLNGNIKREVFNRYKYIDYNYDSSLKSITHMIPYKTDRHPRYWDDSI